MTRTAVSTLGLFLVSSLLLVSGPACDDSGTGNAGTSGGAGTTGSAGTTGNAGTTGSGGSGAPFMAVDPCGSESDYQSGTTVTFGSDTFAYAPKCLKVARGATVQFQGDFSMHPLAPSAKRGTLTGNPITDVSSGTSKSFTFPNAGYYAYYCTYHGPSDGAVGMVGVIWVQ